jgi:hypothetical protein
MSEKGMNDREIILADMKVYGSQGSWDWEADYRFAQAIGAKETAEIYRMLLKSRSPFCHLIWIQRQNDGVRKRRLRALRSLVKAGLVESWWRGTGIGGFSEFGVRKVKSYHLRKGTQ